MPELPEVETMVRGIRPQIAGRRILETEFCRCSRRPITVSPASARFRKETRDCTIESINRIAKRVVIELSGPKHLVIEPRMTGLVLIANPPTLEHRRICWHLQEVRGKVSSFEFWDRRGLGTVRLLNNREFEELKNRLGPDALSMTAADWHQQMSRTTRPVKVAMLDQKLVSGIGNLYASEILHLACISPERSASQLTKQQLNKLSDATQHVLQQAIRYEGSTLGDGTYRNALNQNGSYQNQHRVYAKEDERCPQCRKGTVRRIVQAQRSTFFCPRCQKR